MSYKEVSSKIRAIADKTLTQHDLSDNIIIRRGNEYRAFSEYHIIEMPNYWQVTVDFSDIVRIFGAAKSALAWCIAYKAHKFELAQNISYLDNRLSAKQLDIDFSLGRLKQNLVSPEFEPILQSRLSEDINSRQYYKKQLLKSIQTAKYIKIKGSSHELNRFNKTS